MREDERGAREERRAILNLLPYTTVSVKVLVPRGDHKRENGNRLFI